jgi:NAD(P)-dependent dehydrogenase (short-subunit alcohol dehydrogenase family)
VKNNLFELVDKNCLITGGAGLLGRYHAEALIEAGGTVYISDILVEAAATVAKELRLKYNVDNIHGIYIDVLDSNCVRAACRRIGKVDVLINNAAKDPKVDGASFSTTNIESRFETMSLETWNDGLDVSLNGTFIVSQAVINSMLESNTQGVVLNIASDLSVIAPDQRIYKKENESVDEQNVKPIYYSASKYAMVGMTKYLATYFANKGIRVNAISPGGAFNNHSKEFTDKLSDLIPMKRMASVDEYKGAVIFMCSQASSYMTGQNIIIDGGRSLW